MFDFRRVTLFCFEKRLSEQKMTIFSKNLRAWPPGYAYGDNAISQKQLFTVFSLSETF